jgi:peptide/nickel transport system ATP-binding protein
LLEGIAGVSSPPRDRRDLGSRLIEIRDLSATHGTVTVLHGVELGVNEGECLAVVGESGSGKTTLARCIAGLHDGYEGSIKFGGEAIGKWKDRSRLVRKDMQYVFQNPYASLNPRSTIGSSITTTLLTLEDLSGDAARVRVEEALEAVALSPSVMTKYPRDLSGGQRQRAAIARALVVRPKLLICDEVTSALDVSIQAVIISLIDKLKRDHGLSVVFVTHNLALIENIAESVVVLAGGRVLEQGDVQSVLRNSRSEYTRRLIADMPKFDGSLAGATGHSTEA